MKILLTLMSVFIGYNSIGQSNVEINNNSINSFNISKARLNSSEKQKSVIDYMNHFINKDTSWFINHIIPLNYFVDSILKSSDKEVHEYFWWEINVEFGELVHCCYDSTTKNFIHKNYENEILKTLVEFWKQFDSSTVYNIGKAEVQYELNSENFQSFDFYGVEFTSKNKTFEVEIPKFVIRAGDSKVFFLKPSQIDLMQVVEEFRNEDFEIATFIGGSDKLDSYIRNNLKYPKEMQRNGNEGNVKVEVVISNKGLIKQYKIIQSLSIEADKEVLRLISNMPKWQPALKNGKAVESKIIIPIIFSMGK